MVPRLATVTLISLFALHCQLAPVASFYTSATRQMGRSTSKMQRPKRPETVMRGATLLPPDGNGGHSLSAPLYITIGPPCSGKTTWLKRMKEQTVEEGRLNGDGNHFAFLDICLDDQPYVYVPIPFELFCMSTNEMAEMDAADVSQDNQKLLKRKYFGKTVRERILAEDQQELRWIAQRLSGKMSPQEFEKKLWSRVPNKGMGPPETEEDVISELMVKTLLDSVASHTNENGVAEDLPPTINLFIIEALFRRERENTWSGIERAHKVLRQTPTATSVTWGNTNTKPKDYTSALEVAQQQSRPVHFCVYGCGGYAASLFDLPNLPFSELFDRNLDRFLRKGQYIPVRIMFEHNRRVEVLVSTALNQLKEGGISNPNKWDLECQLARLAQFDLNEDRTVMFRPMFDEKPRQNQWRGNRGPPRHLPPPREPLPEMYQDSRGPPRQLPPPTSDMYHDSRGPPRQLPPPSPYMYQGPIRLLPPHRDESPEQYRGPRGRAPGRGGGGYGGPPFRQDRPDSYWQGAPGGGAPLNYQAQGYGPARNNGRGYHPVQYHREQPARWTGYRQNFKRHRQDQEGGWDDSQERTRTNDPPNNWNRR